MTTKNASTEQKAVVWTISNAEIVEGKGTSAKGDQPIFTFRGTIKRSDMSEVQKGKTFDWTPNLKKSGYTLDLSGFNAETGSGTVIVNGSIGKGGRKPKEAVKDSAKVKSLLALA